MAAFPSIAVPEFPLEEVPRGSTLRTPFEAGYVQTRPRHTRVRMVFRLRWPFMSTADKNTLVTFFTTTVRAGADSFTWTHPVSGTVYTVRFAGDELSCTYAKPGLWEVAVELEQV